jgi:hypothetical protein
LKQGQEDSKVDLPEQQIKHQRLDFKLGPSQDLTTRPCGGFSRLCGGFSRLSCGFSRLSGGFSKLMTFYGEIFRCPAMVSLLLSHFLFNLGINATFALAADRAIHLGISHQVKAWTN